MKKIDELLEKYFKGESSMEEEQILMNLLAEANSSDKYINEKIMFEYFNSEKSRNDISDDFDEKILKAINSNNTIRVDFRRKLHRIINIAAVIAMIIGIYFFFPYNNEQSAQISQEDYKGYVETYNALAKASKYINQVNQNLAKLEVIDESLEQLDKMSYVEYYNNYVYEFLGE
jgi:hypothetical protein